MNNDALNDALKERDDAILHWTKKYIECDDERIKFRRALESIAKNGCCDKCQEAKLVAEAALR